jgi:hypothetical protein
MVAQYQHQVHQAMLPKLAALAGMRRLWVAGLLTQPVKAAVTQQG